MALDSGSAALVERCRRLRRLHDATLPNTEAGLRKLFDKLARQGRILLVVDQPASIGALPVAVARACGHQVAYLPGLVIAGWPTYTRARPRSTPATPT
ncbi:hypothetical protein GCM10023170_097220 [Phytohabitans houttuyneae]|uniref:Transposase IS110-like N-terminal domain-containing protein n=1 Tax=Phytohabitans houttuyneae TaxID=1076126 RepID=A0A6V8K9I2_9ACTN|nr:hypothetical protein Phou_015750 [Phytohabitans houttuyneae]